MTIYVDYGQTCKNADEVSLREAQLVQKYNTQKSVFQKADAGAEAAVANKLQENKASFTDIDKKFE